MTQSPPPVRGSSGGSGCLTAFLVTFLLISLLVNGVLLVVALAAVGGDVADGKKPKKYANFHEYYLSGPEESENRIAVIDLDGVISESIEGTSRDNMVDDFVAKVEQAINPPKKLQKNKPKAIIVRISSPGGEVYASDVMYRALRRAADKMPVVVYLESIAASGGYYAAIGGDYIIANEQTWTGSIGVILQSYNYKSLLDKVGVSALTFKSGPNKDLLNGAREPTEEEKKIVNDLVLETYADFLGLVSSRRGLNADELKEHYADGRILSSKQALTGKLIDEIGDFSTAVKKAEELAGISDALVVRYQPEISLETFFRALGESQGGSREVKVQVLPEHLRLEPGKPYYLSTHLFGDL